MTQVVRRLAGPAGVLALAGVLAFAGTAVPARAAASPAQACLDTFQRVRFVDPGVEGVVIPPLTNHLRPFFQLRDESVCAAIVASIGISRRDGSDFRNQNARVTRSGRLITASADFTPSWRDAGSWMVRQVAISRDGALAVRSFTPTSGAGIQVRRAATLTGWGIDGPGRPLRIGSDRKLTVSGYLKAYGTDGKLHPLPARQQIVLQARRAGTTEPYEPIGGGITSASGYYVATAAWGSRPRQDIRIAYFNLYETISTRMTYVGQVG